MVPTEEERLPVRIPISVRGLSAVNFFHDRTLRFIVSHSFFSHLHRDGHASCRAKAWTNTFLVLYQTILLIKFSLLRSTSFCVCS
jgi:hypothetical protein